MSVEMRFWGNNKEKQAQSKLEMNIKKFIRQLETKPKVQTVQEGLLR